VLEGKVSHVKELEREEPELQPNFTRNLKPNGNIVPVDASSFPHHYLYRDRSN
jgi:hypothetical protein